MKEFTAEMLKTLEEAINSVKGTSEYFKFDTAASSKKENGKWLFLGYYPPHTTGVIKTIKDNTYIITHNGSQRYLVNNEVKNLLGI